MVRARKGAHEAAIEEMRRAGFVRMRIDGRLYETDAEPELDPHTAHDLEAVVDRLVIPEEASGEFLTRLTNSVETALRTGDGFLIAQNLSADPPADILYSERFACPVDGISLPDLQPNSFSFNSPHGACPVCQGLGSRFEIDPARIFPDPSQPLNEAVLSLFGFEREEGQRSQSLWLESLAAEYGFDPELPGRANSTRTACSRSCMEPARRRSASNSPRATGSAPFSKRRTRA